MTTENHKLNPYNSINKLITNDEVLSLLNKYGLCEKIENQIIRDLSIYQRAFTHKSYIKKKNFNEINIEKKPDNCLELQEKSNEVLEFLGDAILSSVIAHYLVERFPDEEEGFLTRMRTKIVNGDSLGKLALKMELNKYVIISRHMEDKCNGRTNIKIMEDVFESLIGAIYIDFTSIDIENFKYDFYSGIGFQICQIFIIEIIEKYIDFTELILTDHNYKEQLMKYMQNKFSIYPKYKQLGVEGASNNRLFTVGVLNNETILAYGKAKTKKKAEQEASKNALIKYNVINQ